MVDTYAAFTLERRPLNQHRKEMRLRAVVPSPTALDLHRLDRPRP